MSSNEYFGKALQKKIDLVSQIAGEDAYCEYVELEDIEHDDNLLSIIEGRKPMEDKIVDDGLRTYVIDIDDEGICVIHFSEISFDILAKNFDYLRNQDSEQNKTTYRLQKLETNDPVEKGARYIEAYIDTKLWVAQNRGDLDEKYKVIVAGIGKGIEVAKEIKERVFKESMDFHEKLENRLDIVVVEGVTKLQEKIFANQINPHEVLKNNTLLQKLCNIYALPYPERVPFKEYGRGLEKYFNVDDSIQCTIIKNHNRKIFEELIPDIVRIKSNLFIGAIAEGTACGILGATVGINGVQIDYINVTSDSNGRESCWEMIKMLIDIQEKCKLGKIKLLLWNDVLRDEEHRIAAENFLTHMGFEKVANDVIRYETEYKNVITSPLYNKKIDSDLLYVTLEDIEMSLWEELQEKILTSDEFVNFNAERLAARSYNRHCTIIAIKDGDIAGAMLIGGYADTYWIHRLYTFDMTPKDILYMTQLVVKNISEERKGNPKIYVETERADRGEFFKQFAQSKISTMAISFVKN